MGKRSTQTKFPVARIKKIMQMDEDVGKVAQATPVAISKSLELFMQSLLDETVKETRRRGAKKIAPYHLKRTVYQTDSFDFLKDIVDKVPDPVEPAPVAERSGKGKGAAAGGGAASKGRRGRPPKAKEEAEEEELEEEDED